MKVYLYLASKILTFTVPQKVSGTFNFDENPEEDSKLINIEAIDSKWYIYSTSDVHVIVGGMVEGRVELKKDNYFTIKRGNEEFLVFITNTFDESFLPYQYPDNMNLVVGNDASCNISFSCPYIKGVAGNIRVQNKVITIDTYETAVYVNNIALPRKTNNIPIKSGDQLNIYGLKIVFLNGFLLLNNPQGQVRCNPVSSGLSPYSLPYGNEPMDKEFKDIEQYSKDQYFSKSPRIRRTIKTKEINLSPPPRQDNEEKMPFILTIGPMMTMGLVSGVMLVNNISKVSTGAQSMQQALPSIITSCAMLASMLVWPTLTRLFNKHLKARKKKELIEKYTRYLNTKRAELETEQKLQKEILIENLISVSECLEIIKNGNARFWDKRIEQSDFLVVRLGRGNELLDVKVNYPEEGFTIDEDELKQKADKMVEDFKYIPDVPIGYSLYKSKLTAFMGDMSRCYGMISNIILQLITFYSYEDIKIVVVTSPLNEDKWDYVKYLNHCFSNDKQIRFFSSEMDSTKALCDYLYMELQNRIQISSDGAKLFKPYYVIFTDNYGQMKRHPFAKLLTEIDMNLGFSLVMVENKMSKLPSKCNNFITLGPENCDILKDSFESQEMQNFKHEIDYSINMMEITRKLSNIPIEFEEGNRSLPDAITFMEMEKVGKVEQLNIMNRWDLNDSTTSLKAEVGVDEEGNLMYLDLHEKFHGPHGLIAGMTGSGKSEFIITYILSMAINYSPDDVAFILIDYKGGGLAFAFENKTTGVSLPHLAGTITNLDKAEMDRTLVSIDSEIKRRQKVFNEARDKLGESTIDIYKYQRFYKDGKLEEPVPHLFIICDEFAELKSQQPDFMDNLISVARIGRSLGVHLILATQKPSGVVNDQIWSNTKFRVCLKVQDESDSKEMLKRPEAASLKQTGRFYLQVGFDEYFALGQSAWCGAKYYPSEKIIKQVDKSVNFIGDVGNVVKSIQSGNNIKIEAQGEQLAAIMNNIIEVAKQTNKRARRLWLNNIDPVILVDNLEKKYNLVVKPYEIQTVIGEYDAPEKQEQGLLVYNPGKQGNTVIYGNDEVEREMFLNTILYSICKAHSASEVNIYGIDYGSEQLRMFNGFPQIGGMVYLGDDEGLKNLLKLITEEIKSRKKLLISYGGSIDSYNNRNEKKLPQILFIINNYEGLLEIYNNINEDIASIGRDCERYGVSLILTCSMLSTLGRRVAQVFNNKYALHLTDPSDYYGIFNTKVRTKPREILGRGVVYNDGIHEFQTASIVPAGASVNDYIEKVKEQAKTVFKEQARKIPTLPEKVTLDVIESEISTVTKVPIGISKDTLRPVKYDFTQYTATTIASNKLENINSFMDSLVDVFLRIEGLTVFFIDTLGLLTDISEKRFNNRKVNYFNSNFEEIVEKLIEVEKNPENSKYRIIYVFYGIEKLKSKVNITKLEELFNAIKDTENSTMIISDGVKNLKSMDMDTWYSRVKNNTDGIWIGKGFSDQQTFRLSKITKDMTLAYKNNFGFVISESDASLMKVLEFGNLLEGEDQDEE